MGHCSCSYCWGAERRAWHIDHITGNAGHVMCSKLVGQHHNEPADLQTVCRGATPKMTNSGCLSPGANNTVALVPSHKVEGGQKLWAGGRRWGHQKKRAVRKHQSAISLCVPHRGPNTTPKSGARHKKARDGTSHRTIGGTRQGHKHRRGITRENMWYRVVCPRTPAEPQCLLTGPLPNQGMATPMPKRQAPNLQGDTKTKGATTGERQH